MYYRFIKITNNNNTKEFLIDITTMKDIRIRLSILNRKYALHYYDQAPYHPIFSILQENCYSYYCCYRGNFDSLNDAKNKRIELTKFYKDKI